MAEGPIIIMMKRRRLRKRPDCDAGQTPVCDEKGNPYLRCMICLEILVAARLRGQLPCGHNQFCHECIETWSRATNKCPLCALRFHTLQQVALCDDSPPILLREDPIQDHNFDPASSELLNLLDFVYCQVCGSDRDEHILLMCDYCDSGYHTSCLGMDCIPNLAVWYCDECLPLLDQHEVDRQWEQMERVGRCRDPEEGSWKRRRRLHKKLATVE